MQNHVYIIKTVIRFVLFLKMNRGVVSEKPYSSKMFTNLHIKNINNNEKIVHVLN